MAERVGWAVLGEWADGAVPTEEAPSRMTEAMAQMVGMEASADRAVLGAVAVADRR